MFRTLTRSRIPTSVVLGAAVALAVLDALVAGSIAQDDKALAPSGETPVPAALPVEAFLAAGGVQTATIDGLRIALVSHADGQQSLRITNPTNEPKRRRLQADCWETSGSLSSRMGPMTTLVHTETLELVVAPGATVTRPLQWQVTPALEAGNPWNGEGFATQQVSLRDAARTTAGRNANANDAPPFRRLLGGQLRPGLDGTLAVLTVPLVPTT